MPGKRPQLSVFLRHFNVLLRPSHAAWQRPIELLFGETRKRQARVAYTLFFALFLTLASTISVRKQRLLEPILQGDVSERDLTAPLSAEIELDAPKDSERLGGQVAPVFDYDETKIQAWRQRWKLAIRELRNAPTLKGVDVEKRLFELTQDRIEKDLADFLHQNRFSEALEDGFATITQPLVERMIAENDLFSTYYQSGIVLRLINHGGRNMVLRDVSRVWSLDQARQAMSKAALATPARHRPTLLRLSRLVAPEIPLNLSRNESLSSEQLASTLERAHPSVVTIHQGQILVRKGEKVSAMQSLIVQKMMRLTNWKSLAERGLISLFLFFVMSFVAFRISSKGRGIWAFSLRDGAVFLAVAAGLLLFNRFLDPVMSRLSQSAFPDIDLKYLLPVASGPILIHLMMGREASLIFSLLFGFSLGYSLDQDFEFGFWSFLVSATAIQVVRSCKRRTDLMKGGIAAGAMGGLFVLCVSWLESLGLSSFPWQASAVQMAASIISGIFSSVLATSLIPVLEALFGYTTSLKLLELANFNHPLLHDLMMKAPGTYHHSIIVGTLAEIAADKVHANALLARVSAYYHDIGKMVKPLYFIENQGTSENLHDQLQPSMSAKILFAHVKDGAKLARDFRLGLEITQIIEQHHGTTLASYFLNRAKKNCKEGEHVDENEFRYPGPRPQTREAAIVMLADSCEAATRSISQPSSAKIISMVHDILTRRMLDKQFEECGLTFSELKTIEDSFARTLISLYHHRIEYPAQKQLSENAPDPLYRKA